MTRYSPIVLFAYNRPTHTLACLRSLQANEAAQCSDLYVYCDGPPEGASTDLQNAIRQTREVIKRGKWCGHMEMFEAATNIGCDASMRRGISEIIESLDTAIILEDDLLVGPQWLDFVNDGLTTYKDDNRVGAISGYMYPVTHRRLPTAFFNRFLNFWGWGTWQRAWNLFESDAGSLLRKLDEQSLTTRFALGRPIYIEYLKALQTREDSYDILWYATLLARDMFVLYPGTSLVSNQGFDLSGTHLAVLDGPNFAFLNQRPSTGRIDITMSTPYEDLDVTAAMEEANAYIWPERSSI